MTDSATLTSWLEGLGLEVKEGSGASGEHLSVAPTDDGDPLLVVQRSNAETWEVVHDRRVPASVLNSDWHAPWDTQPPMVVVGTAAREVACGFPLVEAETRGKDGEVTVRFRAPVFDEGLTRQGFVLTVSAVIKVAQVFDRVLTLRAEELAAWTEFEANSEQRKREQQELIDRMAGTASETTAPLSPPPPPEVPSPAAGWAPTHELRRRTEAWSQPDPGAPVAGSLERRVAVQVVERQGDWARVLCSNGWSAWIDSRDLKVR